MNAFFLNRDVLTSECHWLPKNLYKGQILFEASDPYHICDKGLPFYIGELKETYYEIPKDAVGIFQTTKKC